MIVETGTGNGRYPDTTIDCGPFHLGALTASVSTAMFEILSDSTLKTDMLIKLRNYDAIPGTRHFVSIAHTQIPIFVGSRGDAGGFSLRTYKFRDLHEPVELPGVGLSLTLGEIYENLPVTGNRGLATKFCRTSAGNPGSKAILVSPVGIEPTTPRLKVSCSTN